MYSLSTMRFGKTLMILLNASCADMQTFPVSVSCFKFSKLLNFKASLISFKLFSLMFSALNFGNFEN